MLINLSDVLASEGKVEEKSVSLEMTDFTSRLGRFPIAEKTPVALIFTNIGVGRVKVEGGVKLTLAAECDRCLTEVPVTLNLDFDAVVTSPDAAMEDGENDDPDCMEGYEFNVETFVYHEILNDWPVKILCRENCRGVCPGCGQNLNLGECGCDTFVPDPRMAVLKDIFNVDKEV